MSLTESGNDTNTMGDTTQNDNQRKTAINEIEELAKHDTQMLRTWRIAALLIILGTFVAVTAGTCIFLQKQQEHHVEESVSKFVWIVWP
jgi:hypothetical protein